MSAPGSRCAHRGRGPRGGLPSVLVACYLVLAGSIFGGCFPAEEIAARRVEAPVFVISIDTLRADHLPVYGYDQVDAPAIDRLRKDSILFENAYTACPLTLPAHVSLLTGVEPFVHGVRDNIGYRLDAELQPSLVRALRERGYATGAAVSAYVLHGRNGLATHFDTYDDRIEVTAGAIAELQRPGAETVAIAKDWIDRHRQRPFFFLHLFEPHQPHTPPEPFRSRFGDSYDGEIATADAAVGDFLDHLRRLGLYDQALLVLLSDHGEGLGDHGEEEHGILLHRETIRVPLLLKLPFSERGGTTVSEPAQLLDVFPTVAHLLGFEPPAAVSGKSLLELAEAAPGEAPPRRLYSETYHGRIHFGWSELHSLVDSRFHLIDGPRPELYDLVADPQEKVNVIAQERRVYREMREQLSALATGFEEPGEVDRSEVEKLAALGYLGSSVEVGDGPLPDPKEGLPILARVKSGMELARQGRHREAAEVFAGLVEENPGMIDVRFALCKSLTALGRLEEALAHYRRGIERTPRLAPGLLIEAGRLHLQLGNLEEAERHAGAALEALPAEGHHLLANIALARGAVDLALEQARLAVASESLPRADSMLLLAGVHLLREEHQEALSELDRLQARVRAGQLAAVPRLELERGEALARLGRHSEAAEAFREELRRFPSQVKAYTRLSFVYAVMRQFDKIDPVLEAMVQNNPDPEVFLLAATTVERLGDDQGAKLWRQRAKSAGGEGPLE